ncbi:MAG: alpha/beta fold hydrolase [Saprospiraceae bacterium]
MYRILTLFALTFAFALSLTSYACRDDDDMGMPDPPLCDSTLTPIIFVHGFLASGDTYATQAQRFTANDYCPDYLYAFDWNTLGNQAEAVTKLDALIDEVLQTHGVEKIHLAGHSAGGGLCYNYLSDSTRAAKVAAYVHIGSSEQAGPAGPGGSVPTANIWSAGDKVVPGKDIPGATNISFTDLDHYQVATSAASFEQLFSFFNGGKMPATTAILPENLIELKGRVVTLGENKALVGATIEIYEVDPASGQRIRATPDATLTADSKGGWGPWTAKPEVPYEFFVRTTDPADRPIHYFREGFTRSNRMVYLRMFPPPTSLAGLLLAGIPKDDDQTVLAVFSANQAVVYQRDQLSVNGVPFATDAYANANKTSIAFFLYDDGDGQSSGNIHAAFNFLTSFLVGVDYFIPTNPPGSIELNYNGRPMFVPNWKSDTEGVIVAVFD